MVSRNFVNSRLTSITTFQLAEVVEICNVHERYQKKSVVENEKQLNDLFTKWKAEEHWSETAGLAVAWAAEDKLEKEYLIAARNSVHDEEARYFLARERARKKREEKARAEREEAQRREAARRRAEEVSFSLTLKLSSNPRAPSVSRTQTPSFSRRNAYGKSNFLNTRGLRERLQRRRLRQPRCKHSFAERIRGG